MHGDAAGRVRRAAGGAALAPRARARRRGRLAAARRTRSRTSPCPQDLQPLADPGRADHPGHPAAGGERVRHLRQEQGVLQRLVDRVAELAAQLRQPEDGETVAVLVSDRHDNIGMDPVARKVADEAGATVLLDAGDDTSTGGRGRSSASSRWTRPSTATTTASRSPATTTTATSSRGCLEVARLDPPRRQGGRAVRRACGCPASTTRARAAWAPGATSAASASTRCATASATTCAGSTTTATGSPR